MSLLYVWKRIALGLQLDFGSIGLNVFGGGRRAAGPLKSARLCRDLGKGLNTLLLFEN